jgi:hypothetical protein
MTDVTMDESREPALSAADEQLLRELTERARAGHQRVGWRALQICASAAAGR